MNDQVKALRFTCDTCQNQLGVRQLEVRVYRPNGHKQSNLVRRAPRMLVAGLGLVVLLVSLLAAHSAFNYSNSAPVVVGSIASIGADGPVQNTVSAESSSICEKNCLEGAGSPLFLAVCSVILAVIGFALWTMYVSRSLQLLPRTKEPVEYWPRQLLLFPSLFTPDRLKLSVIRI